MHHRVRGATAKDETEMIWRRRTLAERPFQYRLTYQLRVVLGTKRPTPAMHKRTRRWDAAPAPEVDGTTRPDMVCETTRLERTSRSRSVGYLQNRGPFAPIAATNSRSPL